MTISDEMVERAAIAVHDLKMDEPGLWEKQTDSYKAVYRTGSRVALAAALEGLVVVPAERIMQRDDVVWLREIDASTDNACWVISNRVVPDSVAFFRGADFTRHDGNTATDRGAK